MLFTIENKRFRVSARGMGAELAGFADKADGGYEYIRQPDAVWDRPNLLVRVRGMALS